ncbi:unnamed protein product [Calypogeia fissa]
MPTLKSFVDAPEDLYRCHECGWTYPNPHPSAKDRRNHETQCGKIPGFTRTVDVSSDAQIVNGSSYDGTSEEEHNRSSLQAHEKNGYHHEHPQSPIQAGALNVEQVREKGSSLLSRNHGEALTTPEIHEETASSTRNMDVSHPKDFAKMHKGRGNSRSAHAFKGQWTCRHCGWAYPNAHPSAKNRRKHKKTCGMGPQHVLAGGSSDEASSDDGNGTPDPLKGHGSAIRGSPGPEMIKEVNAKETDLSTDVKAGDAPDFAQVSLESDSRNSLLLHGTKSFDGVLGGKQEEKLESGDSRVAMADKGGIQPSDKQASGVPDASDISVPLIESVHGNQFLIVGEVPNRTISNGVKSSDLDETVVHQLPPNSTSEQAAYKKAHLPEPLQPSSALEHDDQSIIGLERGNSEVAQCQSPVLVGEREKRANVTSSELDMKTPQPTSALRAGNGGESLSSEELRTPGSPEGLVRSRVQLFEKLAGTSPQSLLKSGSPKTNSGSPGLHRSSHVQNGTPEMER